MTRKLMLILCALRVLIVMCGCAGAVKYPSYYTLQVPPPPDPPAQGNLHATLGVREFQSPAYLRQGTIVYRSSPEQIGFYNYHRWASDPREFVSNAVAEHLRAGGAFTQVKPYDGHADIDYVLSGSLEKLEEVDDESGVKVEVAISAQMMNQSTGVVVWRSSVSEVGRVDRRDVPAVVSAMSRTMGKAIDELLTPGPVVPSESHLD
jgi:ABC-type uncharacterized transport system auxiliary subunit